MLRAMNYEQCDEFNACTNIDDGSETSHSVASVSILGAAA